MECQVRGVTVHYEEAGSGRPLLMLHGWPLDHRHVQSDLEPLFESRGGWRRIYPDLPGMGQTQGPEWMTCQDQVLDLVVDFIDAVAPGERFVAGGTSYGGYLVQGLLIKRGDQMDGVLMNVTAFGNPADRQLPPPRVVREDPAFLAALESGEQEMTGFIVAQSLELLAEFRQFFHPAGAVADRDFLQRLDESFEFSFDVNALPAPFPAPALIMAGRHDNWCGYREGFALLDYYPRATFAVLDGAGHALAVEQKTLFRALVSEWLDRIEEYAPERQGR